MQQLLHKVRTLRDDEFTRRYPKETPVRVVVEMRDGRSLVCEVNDWIGFYRRPMPEQEVRYKFDALTSSNTTAELRDRIADVIGDLEDRRVSELTTLLAEARMNTA